MIYSVKNVLEANQTLKYIKYGRTTSLKSGPKK